MSIASAQQSLFSERLAYARWVRQLVSTGAETDSDLATRAGLSYVWLAKWKKRPDAPTERLLCRALARYLFVDEEWLLDGIGEAPHPELWSDWLTAFRKPPIEAPKAATGEGKWPTAPDMPPVAKGFQTKKQVDAKKRRPGDKSA